MGVLHAYCFIFVLLTLIVAAWFFFLLLESFVQGAATFKK